MRLRLPTNQSLDNMPAGKKDWPCDPRPFYPEAEWRLVVPRKWTSIKQVTKLTRSGEIDLFFNPCSGAADKKTPGLEVVQTLEARGAPFTGATSEFYEPSREEMKQACHAEGIATPAHTLARPEEYIDGIECSVLVAENPADAWSADIGLMNAPAGHVGFTRQLARAAFARNARRKAGACQAAVGDPARL